MKRIFLLMFLLLSSCAKEQKNMTQVFTASFITKDSIVSYANQMESTPFEFNGEVHMMISDREHNEILIYKDQTLIHSEPSTLNFAAAYTENNRVYVYGTDGNKIQVIESVDLVTWTQPQTVFTSAVTLYNVSVAKTLTGYVMSYEVFNGRFNIKFLVSNDLYNWVNAGIHFIPDDYAACPTIRQIDGTFYMMYLKDFNGHWATVIAKSTDLYTWKISKTTVLSALGTPGETVNNSDVDIIEYNGNVILNYTIGSQNGDSGIKFAYYNGTMKSFFERFF